MLNSTRSHFVFSSTAIMQGIFQKRSHVGGGGGCLVRGSAGSGFEISKGGGGGGGGGDAPAVPP